MDMPIKKNIIGVNPRMVKRIEKEYAKAYTLFNVHATKMLQDGLFMRYDTTKVTNANRKTMKQSSITLFQKYNVGVVPDGYISISDYAVELSYTRSTITNIIGKLKIGGDYAKVGSVSYLSPEQQARLMNYRIDSENFDRKEHHRNYMIPASNYGKAMGLEAQRLGTQGIRGNYFSDYVLDNFGMAEYERYVNGKQRIDAYIVVDGVAHIIEFKTGNVHQHSHKAQVLGYAKGIRDEGYSDIKVHILYSDNRDQNISWKVDVDVLDDEYNKVIAYLDGVKVSI